MVTSVVMGKSPSSSKYKVSPKRHVRKAWAPESDSENVETPTRFFPRYYFVPTFLLRMPED